jgi:hypothetical protein
MMNKRGRDESKRDEEDMKEVGGEREGGGKEK